MIRTLCVTVLTGFRGDAHDSPQDFFASSFQIAGQSYECFADEMESCNNAVIRVWCNTLDLALTFANPLLFADLLYLGSDIGLAIVGMVRSRQRTETPLSTGRPSPAGSLPRKFFCARPDGELGIVIVVGQEARLFTVVAGFVMRMDGHPQDDVIAFGSVQRSDRVHLFQFDIGATRCTHAFVLLNAVPTIHGDPTPWHPTAGPRLAGSSPGLPRRS